MKRIAVVGSRDYPNLPQVRQYVMELPKGTVVISGGARGVDREAEIAAYIAGLGVEIFFADWKANGKEAGFMRNFVMANVCDEGVVFWDGKSRGAAHFALAMLGKGKPCTVYTCRETPPGVVPNDGKLKRLPKGLLG